MSILSIYLYYGTKQLQGIGLGRKELFPTFLPVSIVLPYIFRMTSGIQMTINYFNLEESCDQVLQVANVLSTQDYYPFGMVMPGRSYQGSDGYRYGFNGKEMDNEVHGGTGNQYDYGFRIYNPRLGRFLSVDPLTRSFPYYTPYQFSANTPISAIDLDGLEAVITVHSNSFRQVIIRDKKKLENDKEALEARMIELAMAGMNAPKPLKDGESEYVDKMYGDAKTAITSGSFNPTEDPAGFIIVNKDGQVLYASLGSAALDYTIYEWGPTNFSQGANTTGTSQGFLSMYMDMYNIMKNREGEMKNENSGQGLGSQDGLAPEVAPMPGGWGDGYGIPEYSDNGGVTQGSEDLWEKFLTYRLKDKVTLAEDIARLPQGDTFIFLGQDHTGLYLFIATRDTNKRTGPAARGDDGQWIRATDNDVSKYGN